jgi:hypothetical protein
MQLKNWLYKYKYLLIAFTILTIITFVIRSITPKTTKTVSTIPNIQLTPSQALPSDYSQKFSNKSRISITDSSRVLSINEEKRLVLNVEGKEFPISPEGTTVINYVSSNDSIVYETGIYAGKNNKYYFYDMANNLFGEVNLESVKPLISYSLNQDNTTLAVIGNYEPKGFTSSLYFVNILSGITDQKQKDISASNIKWINDDILLVSKEIDKSEPNNWISFYSKLTNKIVPKEIPAVKKSISFSQNKDSVYFVNSENLDLLHFSSSNLKLQKISSVSTLDVETVSLPNNQLLILQAKKNEISTSVIDIASGKITSSKNYSLNPQEIYIEKFQSGENIFIKTYNKENKEYLLKKISL